MSLCLQIDNVSISVGDLADATRVAIGDSVVRSATAGGRGGDPTVTTNARLTTALDQKVTAGDSGHRQTRNAGRNDQINGDRSSLATHGRPGRQPDGQVIGMNTAAR